MLSNASKYAIRSMLYLAIHTNEVKKIGVRKIAEELKTPQPFLAKLLQQLAKDQIVSSTKGPNGGFFLNKKNKENTVWDIIESIDGLEKFNQCFLGLPRCSDENPCPVHFSVIQFRQKILKDFRDKTIAEFANEIKDDKNLSISLKDPDVLND